MGTRLYPRTTNELILERLAGVPSGTAQQLSEFQAKLENQPDSRDLQANCQAYLRLQADQKLSRLNDFILFGWGRLTSQSYKLIQDWALDQACGCTTAPQRVELLLSSCSVTLAKCEVELQELTGVCWY